MGATPLIAACLAAALLTALLLQLLLTLLFAWVVQRRLSRRPPLKTPAPAAAVVLCLRGADPSLPAVLTALAQQNYPGPWRLLLLIDSSRDPAWAVAQAQIARLQASGLARWQAAQLAPLRDPPAAQSRKCAGLRQAFELLEASTALVALVDADAVVAPGWLTALAAACDQHGIGAVSGNRWYTTSRGSAASAVRSIWNGGALVLMTLLQIPWGGSLAIRRSLIAESAWSDVLATSLCEDTALPAPLARAGWRYQFRPELLALADDDSVALRPLRRWITRQLLCARLHHPAWPLVAVHGLGTWLLLLLALPVLALTLVEGQLASAVQLVAALIAYELGCVGLLLLITAVARRSLEPLGTTLAPTRWASAMRLLRWLPLAQWVYGLATLRAALARHVEWRGVHYAVRGRGVERLISEQRSAP